MQPSLFERCGGFAQVRRVVSAFYERLLDSPTLCHHFDGIDMSRLVDHQTKFVAMAMNGPAAVSDEALRRAHAHLGISAIDFRETARLLRETLEEFGLAAADVATVMGAVERREALIVTR